MTTATFIRPDQGLTLASLEERLSEARSGTSTHDVPLSGVHFALTGNQSVIRLGDEEVPATEGGLEAFGSFLGVPSAFLARVGKTDLELQEVIMNGLLNHVGVSAASVRYGEGGVSGVFEAGKAPLDPRRLIAVASKVLGTEDAPIQRLVDTQAEFAFDTHVPFTHDEGVGGDATSLVEVPEDLLSYSWTTHLPVRDGARVGDLTAGGLRFGVDLKRGLAPSVQPFTFRLACTNGMEHTDTGLKVDARGLSVEEVLADLEVQAERAFSRVESQIEHFYRMRDQPVENPEREIIRLANERGLPQRSVTRLLEAAPTEALPDDPTRFDVVNLITNLANSPAMRNDGGRMLLERAGGSIVSDDAVRCGHCHARIVNH